MHANLWLTRFLTSRTGYTIYEYATATTSRRYSCSSNQVSHLDWAQSVIFIRVRARLLPGSQDPQLFCHCMSQGNYRVQASSPLGSRTPLYSTRSAMALQLYCAALGWLVYLANVSHRQLHSYIIAGEILVLWSFLAYKYTRCGVCKHTNLALQHDKSALLESTMLPYLCSAVAASSLCGADPSRLPEPHQQMYS